MPARTSETVCFRMALFGSLVDFLSSVGEAEEEEDFEEMLQRGLTEKKDLARRLRAGRLDSDSDSFDEADLAEEDTFDDIGALESH